MDKYNQKWVLLLAGKNPRFAVTLGQTAYYSCPAVFVTDSWRRHEDKHKEQWRTEGRVRFAVKYLWYELTRGYVNNPYEIEARAAETVWTV